MKWLAYWYLRMSGWTFVGGFPDVPKLIAIGAPHTTNWDFIVFLGALHHWKIKVRYLGKHTLFRWPFGYFFRFLGGIPVDRSGPGGVVGQVKAVFDASEKIILVIAPEGTRKAVPFWKSGFLKLAKVTGAPIVFAGIDFSRKEATIGPLVHYDGNVEAFMEKAREFFADKEGLHPELKGPVAVNPDL